MTKIYLLKEFLNRRHELNERLPLLLGERLREGEHLSRLELSTEQVQSERGTLTRSSRRLRRGRRRLAATAAIKLLYYSTRLYALKSCEM